MTRWKYQWRRSTATGKAHAFLVPRDAQPGTPDGRPFSRSLCAYVRAATSEQDEEEHDRCELCWSIFTEANRDEVRWS
jgi:hypothetical protein